MAVIGVIEMGRRGGATGATQQLAPTGLPAAPSPPIVSGHACVGSFHGGHSEPAPSAHACCSSPGGLQGPGLDLSAREQEARLCLGRTAPPKELLLMCCCHLERCAADRLLLAADGAAPEPNDLTVTLVIRLVGLLCTAAPRLTAHPRSLADKMIGCFGRHEALVRECHEG